MMSKIEVKYLKPTDAASYLGVGFSTMAKWRIDGDGPSFLKVGGSVRYSVADLDAWMQRHRQQSTSETLRTQRQA